jgi:hypothetical protein
VLRWKGDLVVCDGELLITRISGPVLCSYLNLERTTSFSSSNIPEWEKHLFQFLERSSDSKNLRSSYLKNLKNQ